MTSSFSATGYESAAIAMLHSPIVRVERVVKVKQKDLHLKCVLVGSLGAALHKAQVRGLEKGLAVSFWFKIR